MSASSKQTSRWGSFLQQAVAGVESRLDNMLLDGVDEPTAQKKPSASTPPPPAVRAEGAQSYQSLGEC